MSANLINIDEQAFLFRHKNIISFLAVHYRAVLLGIKNNLNRYDVKCLAFTPAYEVCALFTGKWYRSLIIYKVMHYAFFMISGRKNTTISENTQKKNSQVSIAESLRSDEP